MPSPHSTPLATARRHHAGLWDYIHSRPIADNYDAYFSYNRLFQFDEQVVLCELERPRDRSRLVVADLGCGTGRICDALGRHRIRGLAVDLSEPMLAVVRAKAQQEKLPIDCVRANLVNWTAWRTSRWMRRCRCSARWA